MAIWRFFWPCVWTKLRLISGIRSWNQRPHETLRNISYNVLTCCILVVNFLYLHITYYNYPGQVGLYLKEHRENNLNIWHFFFSFLHTSIYFFHYLAIRRNTEPSQYRISIFWMYKDRPDGPNDSATKITCPRNAIYKSARVSIWRDANSTNGYRVLKFRDSCRAELHFQ